MDISTQTKPGNVYVISLSGEFDLFERENVDSKLNDVYLKTPKALILNLTGISFIDSTGVGLLLTFYAKLKEEGIYTALVLDSNKHVMRRLGRLLLLTDPALKFYDSTKEAIGDIGQSVL